MNTKIRLKRLIENNWLILVNAGSLVGTLAITSGLGFAFWWLVAREFELLDAGLAAAIISAMFLLGTIGMMGMGTLMIGELSRHPQSSASLITSAVLLVGVSSFLLGLGFASVSGFFGFNFAILLIDWRNALLFAVGVSITAITLVLDQALLGLLRGGWQLWRNSIFALSKLLLLIPAGYYFRASGAIAIYATWLVGNILSLALLIVGIGRKRLRGRDYMPQWGVIWKLRSNALAHHVLNLALQTIQFSMPIIVTVLISPEANASFYVAWLIASSLFIIPTSLTQTLYAVSAADVAVLAQKIRFTLRMSFLGVTFGGLAVFLLAHFILEFFNPIYAITATESLRVLLLAAFPMIVRAHYVAIHQIRREISRAAIQFWIMISFELALATLGAAIGGLIGLSVGWTLAVYFEGIIMIPLILRISLHRESPLKRELPVTAEESRQ